MSAPLAMLVESDALKTKNLTIKNSATDMSQARPKYHSVHLRQYRYHGTENKDRY